MSQLSNTYLKTIILFMMQLLRSGRTLLAQQKRMRSQTWQNLDHCCFRSLTRAVDGLFVEVVHKFINSSLIKDQKRIPYNDVMSYIIYDVTVNFSEIKMNRQILLEEAPDHKAKDC